MGSRVASLVVEIGANVSGFQAAAGQVKSGLNSIANQAKSTGNILGGTGSQIDQFNTKARALNQAYATGAISQREYTRQGQALAWSMMSGSEKFDVMRQRVQSFTTNMIGASAIVGVMGKQVYNFARSGAEIEYTTQRFDRLARSIGSTGDAFLDDLRGATKGTVSDFGLLKQGSDLLQLGLAGSREEAIRLSRVMTALGMDTGELTLALANQSKRRLDQLGLSLTKFNEIESRLKDTGMTKEQAFKEAFMQTAEITMGTIGNQADSGLGDMKRFEAEMANTWNEMKQMFVDSTPMLFGNQSISTTMGQVANSMRELRRLAGGETSWQNFGWNSDTNQIDFDVREKAPYYNDQRYSVYQRGNMRYTAQTPGGRGNEQIRGAGDYSGMAAYYNRTSPTTGGEGASQTPLDYAALLSGGLAVTKMLDQFNSKTYELNQAIAEESEELETLTQRYGENSEKVAEQRDKVDSLRAGLGELRTNMQQTTEEWASGMLNMRGATEQQQLEFSRATGQISQDSYEAAQANNKLSDAYMAGKISAGDYASAVSQLMGWVSKMDGMQVDTYIDVWIRQHGGGGVPIISAFERTGQTCFSGDTLVDMGDGSKKEIRKIEAGDRILSYDLNAKQAIETTVEYTFEHDKSEVEKYLLINNHLRVTAEHLIWNSLEWVAAGDLKVGDLLLGFNGDFVFIKTIETIEPNETVYNLHTDHESHNYFAGGVLVHNGKTQGNWTGGQLNSDGFTVVGDAPGGGWGPHTEVIYNGHVFNARESRALRAAGLLEGAVYRANVEGSGGGSGFTSGGVGGSTGNYTSSGGTGSRRQAQPGRTSLSGMTTATTTTGGSGGSSGGGNSAADVATIAQVSNNTAAIIVSTQQSTQENMQNQTRQQVQATQESQAAVVDELREVTRILKKQADKNDLYAIFRGTEKLSI